MLISNNAYGILGLGIDSNEKNINKRYKEQLKFLEIEEIPEYDSDFSFIDYSKIRTSESIKEAFHKLSNQKKKIYQAFLWFQILDKSDEDALQNLIQGDIVEAIELWSQLYNETNKLHYLKNAVIANLLGCEHRKQFDDLDFSKDPEFIVDGLYECIYSQKFWKEFIDILNLTSDTPISEEELEKFKYSLPQTLAEEFFDVAEDIKMPKLYITFSKKFGLNAKELDDNKNVTEPVHKIEKDMEELDKEWNFNYKQDYEKVVDVINEIEEALKKIKKIGLYETPKFKKLRDEIARKINRLGCELTNNYYYDKQAKDFFEMALSICSSGSLNKTIAKNLSVVSENVIEKNKEQEELNELKNKYGGWLPGMCWYCKTEKARYEDEIDIHKVIEKTFNGKIYNTGTLKIPCCSQCYNKIKRRDKNNVTISIILGIILGGVVLLKADVKDGGTWFIAILVAFLVWGILYGILDWIMRLFGASFSKYPVRIELQKQGWEEGSTPSR